jgi:hypothetical protein
MTRPRASRWVWLIPAFGAGLMGASLLLQAAHWFTDIVGGGLLAAAVLAISIGSGASSRLHDQPLNDHEPAGSGREGQLPSLTSASQADIESRHISAMPDSRLADCYDPARGKLVLRSYGGL